MILVKFMVDEGYILSNKFRIAIFDEIVSGETNIDRIIKKHRLIKSVSYRIIDDFISKGIIRKDGNKYVLTDDGIKLSKQV